MNPTAFGRHRWYVLHALPWILPGTEIAIESETATHFVVVFRDFVVDAMACSACAHSAPTFVQDLNFPKAALRQNTLGQWVLLRGDLNKFLVKLHNCVNNKLQRPLQNEDLGFEITLDFLNSSNLWVELAWDFLFLVSGLTAKSDWKPRLEKVAFNFGFLLQKDTTSLKTNIVRLFDRLLQITSPVLPATDARECVLQWLEWVKGQEASVSVCGVLPVRSFTDLEVQSKDPSLLDRDFVHAFVEYFRSRNASEIGDCLSHTTCQ